MVRMRPWQLALVVVTCAAAALVAVRATAVQLAGDGPERTVVVTMHHSRFEPATIRIEAGRRVRFVLRNTDPIDHEWLIGDAAFHERHRTGTEPAHGDRPDEVSVPALSSAQTTLTFDEPGDVVFICHFPGHEAYGMVGVLHVT